MDIVKQLFSLIDRGSEDPADAYISTRNGRRYSESAVTKEISRIPTIDLSGVRPIPNIDLGKQKLDPELKIHIYGFKSDVPHNLLDGTIVYIRDESAIYFTMGGCLYKDTSNSSKEINIPTTDREIREANRF